MRHLIIPSAQLGVLYLLLAFKIGDMGHLCINRKTLGLKVNKFLNNIYNMPLGYAVSFSIV